MALKSVEAGEGDGFIYTGGTLLNIPDSNETIEEQIIKKEEIEQIQKILHECQQIARFVSCTFLLG